jgi:hypothetical protein
MGAQYSFDDPLTVAVQSLLMKPMFLRLIGMLALVVFLAMMVLCVMSCGGRGVGKPSGAVRLSIRWPQTRDIPAATRSLRITAQTLVSDLNGGTKEDVTAADRVIPRPSGEQVSNLVLDHLPSVEVRIKAFAYTSSDGTGSAIAQGATDIHVPENLSVAATLTLTGDTITISVHPLNVALLVGESSAIAVTAKDSSNTEVDIDDVSRITFASSNDAIATVMKRTSGTDADVSAIGLGEATVHVSDTVGGQSFDIPVRVVSAPGCQQHVVTLNGLSKSELANAQLFDPNTSSAIASTSDGGVVAVDGVSGSAKSVDFYMIDAPEIIGTFQAIVSYRAVVAGNEPNISGSGTVTVSWPGGTNSYSDFAVHDVSVPITVRSGDIVKLEGRANAQSPEGGRASASYSVWISQVPDGVHVRDVFCSVQ